MMELFPDAEIFILVYRPEQFGDRFRNRHLTASRLQRLPFGKTFFPYYLPLFWGMMRGFDLSPYDLIVSTGSACAKWVRPPQKALHIHYCLGLPGKIWEEGGENGIGIFPRWEESLFRDYLRKCDLQSNEGVTHFLVVSEEMKGLVHRLYGREAEVIAAPVDAKFLFRSQVYFRKLFGIPTIPGNDRF